MRPPSSHLWTYIAILGVSFWHEGAVNRMPTALHKMEFSHWHLSGVRLVRARVREESEK